VIFRETSIPGAYLIDLELREDERGFNARAWCQQEFEDRGLTARIAQVNVLHNKRRATLRGMHYQAPPHAEAKVFRVTRGAVHDVIVDLRPGSAAYGRWETFQLSSHVPTMLYVPESFGQGFQTLEDDTDLVYFTSAPYAPEAERGFRYDDRAFGLEWPLPVEVISLKDRSWPDFVLDQPLTRPA
jgi:dTDP-4-dehydrorhamnose 3,5-epimerase